MGHNGDVLDCSAKHTGGTLTSVPTTIPPTVIHIWLSNNQISSISATDFAGLHSLKYLYLDGNLIASIAPGAFDSLNSLVILLLNNNALTELPDGLMTSFVNLEALDLRSNALARLSPTTFAGLNKLVYLNLFGNSVTSIGCGTFNVVSALGYINMGSNPSSCSVNDHASGILSCVCSDADTGGFGFCSDEAVSECGGRPPIMRGYTQPDTSTALPFTQDGNLVPLDRARFTSATPVTIPGVLSDNNVGSAETETLGDRSTGVMLAGLVGGVAVLAAIVGVAVNVRINSQRAARSMGHTTVTTSSAPSMHTYESSAESAQYSSANKKWNVNHSQVDLVWDDCAVGPTTLSWNASESELRSEAGESTVSSSVMTSIMNRTMAADKWKGSMWNRDDHSGNNRPSLSICSSESTL